MPTDRGGFEQLKLNLLIIRDSDEPRRLRVAKAYRALRGLGMPKDLLSFIPREVADWRDVVNHVVWSALRDGRILYEKRP